MCRIVAIVCVLSTATALAAPAPLPKRGRLNAAAEDLRMMQGEWIVTQRTLGGGAFGSAGITALITGDRIKYLLVGEVRTEWAITLDPTKSPKHFDRKRLAVVGKDHDLTLLGIYKLDGDTLTICHSSSDASQQRPVDFNGSHWLTIMKRKR